MKCIRNLETQEVKRVSNVSAFKHVNTGKWIYSDKKTWKEAGRP